MGEARPKRAAATAGDRPARQLKTAPGKDSFGVCPAFPGRRAGCRCAFFSFEQTAADLLTGECDTGVAASTEFDLRLLDPMDIMPRMELKSVMASYVSTDSSNGPLTVA